MAAALAASVLHTACADQTASQVSLAQLPVQARTTYERIHNGGPFPYDKDGSIFGNRERLLPAEKRGYYREYTVKTPRERSRGGAAHRLRRLASHPARCLLLHRRPLRQFCPHHPLSPPLP